MNVAIEVRSGSAGELHTLDPFAAESPTDPAVWVCDVTAPAIVLGSRQTPDILDLDACARAGLEVATRRSGGGAVLLRPDAMCWIDVVVPHGIAPEDVRGSMVWIGDVWRDALIALGAEPSRLVVHRDGMTCTPWSGLVCFAGLGPGEVLVGGRKLVGLSQRRTRHGIRVQCQVHRAPLLRETSSLFAGSVPDVEPVEPALLFDALTSDVDDITVARAVATALGNRTTAV